MLIKPQYLRIDILQFLGALLVDHHEFWLQFAANFNNCRLSVLDTGCQTVRNHQKRYFTITGHKVEFTVSMPPFFDFSAIDDIQNARLLLFLLLVVFMRLG